MNEPLLLWAKMMLRLGLVLLGIGIVPLALIEYRPYRRQPADRHAAGFHRRRRSAVLATLVAIILFLAARLRRRRGSS